MASIVYFIVGLVIGAIAGWLLRGRQASSSQPTATATTAGSSSSQRTTSSVVTAPSPATGAEAAPPATGDSASTVDEATPVTPAPPLSARTESPEPSTAPTAPATEAPAVAATTAEPAAEAAESAPVADLPAPRAEAEPILPAALETDNDDATVAAREPDDLTRIPGVGPKSAMALAAAGITTYDRLAATDVSTLRAAIVAAGMRPAASLATWPQQALKMTGAADTTASSG